MIIFDLNHFEKIVSEAPSIIGGERTIACSNLLSESLLKRLSPEIRNRLSKRQCRVSTVTIRRQGRIASSTTAVSNDGEVSIAIATASSSSS